MSIKSTFHIFISAIGYLAMFLLGATSDQFNLIELTDKDIERLDDILPPKLRKFGIKID